MELPNYRKNNRFGRRFALVAFLNKN